MGWSLLVSLLDGLQCPLRAAEHVCGKTCEVFALLFVRCPHETQVSRYHHKQQHTGHTLRASEVRLGLYSNVSERGIEIDLKDLLKTYCEFPTLKILW